jgi:hypothetical protein
MMGSCGVAGQLAASEEGLSSMKLVIRKSSKVLDRVISYLLVLLA